MNHGALAAPILRLLLSGCSGGLTELGVRANFTQGDNPTVVYTHHERPCTA